MKLFHPAWGLIIRKANNNTKRRFRNPAKPGATEFREHIGNKKEKKEKERRRNALAGLTDNDKEQLVEQILLEKYNNYYRLAYSYVHNEADAGDIVQNGAYKAILHSDSLKQKAYAATWIYRIMLNEIFRFLKSNPGVKEVFTPPEEMAGKAAGKEDIYQDVDLMRVLDALPQEVRTVIVLRYFEDLTLEQIANVQEENVNTVKSRLYRGLKKMRLELSC